MRVKLLVSYEGTDFKGWQKQKLGVLTVQGVLEEALFRLFGESISIIGASRTDGGVHARGQVCHFDVDKDLKRYNVISGLNRFAPACVSVKKAWVVSPNFHALHCAIEKTYKYRIQNNPFPEALEARFTHWVKFPLNEDILNSYSQFLVGTHDFKSFQTKGTDVKTTVRTINSAYWQKKRFAQIEFTIKGTGFLKQMVRNIVGTQLDLLRLQKPAQDFKNILDAGRRDQALSTAPAQGLCLEEVRYSSEGLIHEL